MNSTAALLLCRQKFAENLDDKGNVIYNLNLDSWTVRGDCAIVVAAQNGHDEVIKSLLEMRADIDANYPRTGVTALITACRRGRAQEVEFLLNNDVQKADVHRRTTSSYRLVGGEDYDNPDSGKRKGKGAPTSHDDSK